MTESLVVGMPKKISGVKPAILKRILSERENLFAVLSREGLVVKSLSDCPRRDFVAFGDRVYSRKEYNESGNEFGDYANGKKVMPLQISDHVLASMSVADGGELNREQIIEKLAQIYPNNSVILFPLVDGFRDDSLDSFLLPIEAKRLLVVSHNYLSQRRSHVEEAAEKLGFSVKACNGGFLSDYLLLGGKNPFIISPQNSFALSKVAQEHNIPNYFINWSENFKEYYGLRCVVNSIPNEDSLEHLTNLGLVLSPK